MFTFHPSIIERGLVMFTSWSRVRGRRGFRRRGWRCPNQQKLFVSRLEERNAPAQLVVTSATDDGGAGTLRSIIAIANSNGEADTVTFDTAVNSITLATGQLTISESKNLSIDGGGMVTINGAATASATNRIFNITATGKPTIAMQGLTLAKGNLSSGNGGAVLVTDQVLQLTDVTLTNNQAKSWGGALATGSGSIISITDCYFGNNGAGTGGAISIGSVPVITISYSTFSGNSATGPGGAINIGGASTINLDHSRFDKNTSGNYGGGAINADYTLELTDIASEFTNNQATKGGAICLYSPLSGWTATIKLNSSALSSNTATSYGGGAVYLYKGTLDIDDAEITNNVAKDGGGGGISTGYYVDPATNITITKSTIANNLSGDYGGGLSIAAANIVLTDCTITENTAGQYGGGGLTFNGGMIAISNCTITNNTAQLGGGGISLDGETISVSKCTFDGNKIGVTGEGAAMSVSGTSTTVADCKIVNHVAYRGAVALFGTASVSNSTISSNSSAYGGGIYVGSGTITINSSTITNNSATIKGGGAYMAAGTITLAKTTISNNTASLQGGGLYCAKGAATISDSTIAYNSVDGSIGDVHGGGIRAVSESVSINNSSITNNFVNSYLYGRPTGAGLSMSGGSIQINASTIADNVINSPYLDGFGSGLYITSDSITITNSTVSGNAINAAPYISAFQGGLGAGFYIRTSGSTTGQVTISNSAVVNNFGPGNGGGIWVSSSVPVTIGNSTISGNIAYRGGGIFVYGTSPSMESCIVAANSATFNSDVQAAKIIGNNNLIGVLDPAIVTIVGANNIVGSKANPIDPGLLPLGNYGGPLQTMGLKYTSPAIDHGNNSAGLTVDQRGQPRESPTGLADIGAFEFGQAMPFVAQVPPIAVVTTSGADPMQIVVTYAGPSGIDPMSLDAGDIAVIGAESIGPVSFIGFTTSGTQMTATYAVNAPGGIWDAKDNGHYVIKVNANQVSDTSVPAKTANAQPIGSFQVQITGSLVIDSAADGIDGNFGPGQFTLREAILVANSTPSAPDTISFDPNIFASQKTITLGSELLVTDSIIINGPGAQLLSISGNGANRIINSPNRMTFNFTQPIAIALSGLTLKDGKTVGKGGAINAAGPLTITDCVLSNNSATFYGGAVAVLRHNIPLSISRSHFSGNWAGSKGGGVYIYGSSKVSISTATFNDNYGKEYGGGVFLWSVAELSMSECTLNNNNSADGGGVGLYQNSSSKLFIENSTISGNTAAMFGGGVSVRSSTVKLFNCTVTANSATNSGGGIYGDGDSTVGLDSSIVAANMGLNGSDVFFNASRQISGNNNLIGIADSGNFMLSGTANLTGTKANPLDPKLGPLGDNGGPTRTHALLPGSPAINAGSNTNKLTTDQRGIGFVRSVGGQPDIGAFEIQTPPPRALSVQVNDSSAQRSIVTSFKVTFSEPVVFPFGLAAAFELQRIGPSGATGTVNLDAIQAGNVVTITFAAGGPIALDPGGSLIDGKFKLSIIASKITGVGGQLDGNSDGAAGDNFNFLTHRLFGDSNGDGRVDTTDLTAYRTAIGIASTTFDFNADGVVNSTDFAEFRKRFGLMI